jgi:hypothetical protein
MEKTHIIDMIPAEMAEKKAKLLFLFDTMCDRTLFIQVREVIEHKHLLEPTVVVNKGKAPKQEGDIDSMFQGLSDDVNSMYGDEDYDPDELDAEGYQDLEDIESGGF